MAIRLSKLPAGFALPPQKPRTASKPRQRAKSPGKAPAPSEREIQRNIVTYLESLGAAVIRINSGAVKTDGRYTRFNSLPGCPDLLVCFPEVKARGFQTCEESRFVAIEVKSARGTVTELQADAQAKLRRAGAVIVVARCVEDVRTALETEGLS